MPLQLFLLNSNITVQQIHWNFITQEEIEEIYEPCNRSYIPSWKINWYCLQTGWQISCIPECYLSLFHLLKHLSQFVHWNLKAEMTKYYLILPQFSIYCCSWYSTFAMHAANVPLFKYFIIPLTGKYNPTTVLTSHITKSKLYMASQF